MNALTMVGHNLEQFVLLLLLTAGFSVQKVAPVAESAISLSKEYSALLGLVSIVCLLVLPEFLCPMSKLAPVTVRAGSSAHKLLAQF